MTGAQGSGGNGSNGHDAGAEESEMAKGASAFLDVRGARAALQAARGKDKLDLLLSAPDPVALVQAIPAQELYLAILDAGPEDAPEVIALASPEQFRHFVDMACWPARGDAGPEARRVLEWLGLARETVGTSDARLARYQEKLAGLDPELLSLVLARELILHDLRANDDPHVQSEGSIYRTPDGHFLIEFRGGDKAYPALKGLLDDLYRQDVLGTTRMLESTRWDLPTELEEIERRWRDGRLRDQGIPDLEEALSFFARPLRAKGAPRPAASPGTQTLAAPPAGPPLLDRALAQLSTVDRDRAEEGVIYAVNAAVVASGAGLDDPFALRTAVEDAYATLSLGLAVLAGDDDARAARALAERPVREVFQAAMGEAYRLQARARAVQRKARLPQAQSVTLLDSPLSELVDALAAQRPRIPGEAKKSRPRALAGLHDLARADAWLDEAEAVVALLDALRAGPAALGPLAEEANVGPATLHASDVARALVGAALRGEPFSLRTLPDAHGPKLPGFARKLAELLDAAARKVGSEPALRAAARLKGQLT
ncbi:MAG: hypothetical protein NVSMB23_30400 [Myxococcales bacterium]